MNDRFQALRNIAPKLDRLREDPNARVNYELMSDGLVWIDELPPIDELEPTECNCLRGVWRFRASLIMGSPEEKFRPAWEAAQKLFSNWPGFLRQRQLTSWREFFMERSAKLNADWEALDARFEKQKAERSEKPTAAV